MHVQKATEQQLEEEHSENKTSPSSHNNNPSTIRHSRDCYDKVKAAFSVSNETLSFNFCSEPCVQAVHRALANSRLLHDPHFLSPLVHNKQVLINSPGGVGSTYFVTRLKHLGFGTNDVKGRDGLKHTTVERLLVNQDQRPQQQDSTTTTLYESAIVSGRRFQRLLYIVGDPIHSIFSHYRRGWERNHYGRFCGKFCKFYSKWQGNITAVFAASAQLGYDAWSLHNQATQWRQLQQMLHFTNHDEYAGPLNTNSSPQPHAQDYLRNGPSPYPVFLRFPPILVTDIATAQESPAVLAHFLGVAPSQIQQSIRLQKQDTAASNHSNSNTTDLRRQQAERALVQQAGALDIYLNVENDLQETVAHNYLAYGIHMLCSGSQSSSSLS